MNIDLAALRALEREREIPFDTILAAIETALLTAYRHTDGAEPHARVEIDRKTGAALVLRPGAGRRRHAWCGSGTTPRTTSAGSPR